MSGEVIKRHIPSFASFVNYILPFASFFVLSLSSYDVVIVGRPRFVWHCAAAITDSFAHAHSTHTSTAFGRNHITQQHRLHHSLSSNEYVIIIVYISQRIRVYAPSSMLLFPPLCECFITNKKKRNITKRKTQTKTKSFLFLFFSFLHVGNDAWHTNGKWRESYK